VLVAPVTAMTSAAPRRPVVLLPLALALEEPDANATDALFSVAVPDR